MTKIPSKKTGPTKAEIEALDLDQDAWPKFEQLIRTAAKTPPTPHNSKGKAGKDKQSRGGNSD